jgi:hypothetical protein
MGLTTINFFGKFMKGKCNGKNKKNRTRGQGKGKGKTFLNATSAVVQTTLQKKYRTPNT